MSSRSLSLEPRAPEEKQSGSQERTRANPQAPAIERGAGEPALASQGREVPFALEQSRPLGNAASAPRPDGRNVDQTPPTESAADDPTAGASQQNTAFVPADERRRRARPMPPAPSLRVRIDRLIDPLAGRIEHSRPAQIIWALLVIGALAWCGWLLGPGLTAVNKHTNRVEYRERLGYEHQQLTRRWSAESMRSAHTRLAEAEEGVCPSYQVLSAWLTDFARQANERGIAVGYTVETGGPLDHVDGVSEIPLRIKLSAMHDRSVSFQTLLESVRGLLDTPWRVELGAAVVSSSADRPVIGLRLALLVRETLVTETARAPEL